MRLRYLLLLMLVLAGSFFLLKGPSKEETLAPESDTVSAMLRPQDLCVITPETIRQNNLTIDWQLQKYIADTVRRNKVYFASVVVMDATSGDILALYGKNLREEDCSLCMDTFLAASLFKTVTATAALEYGNMEPGTTFEYNGRAHTLYKSQLDGHKNRWTRKATLSQAFARSNNVIFAKIGTDYLGEGPVLLAALKYGFWRPPLKECISDPSVLFIPENEYNLAELASGFNRYTKISPLHAAQMASSVVNGGEMITPRLKTGGEFEGVRIMSSETAHELDSMMRRTINRGTMSRAFRGYTRDRVLKNLVIGAKSGSINGTDPDGRRNWFMGYARDRNGQRKIAVGCLVIRDDYFWIEADGLAKIIIRYYFSRPDMTVAQK